MEDCRSYQFVLKSYRQNLHFSSSATFSQISLEMKLLVIVIVLIVLANDKTLALPSEDNTTPLSNGESFVNQTND